MRCSRIMDEMWPGSGFNASSLMDEMYCRPVKDEIHSLDVDET